MKTGYQGGQNKYYGGNSVDALYPQDSEIPCHEGCNDDNRINGDSCGSTCVNEDPTRV